MEGIHGVDVSWLHHSNKDSQHRPHAPSSPGLTRDVKPPVSSNAGHPPDHQLTSDASTSTNRHDDIQTTSAPSSSPNSKALPRRPQILGRSGSEKTPQVQAGSDPQRTPPRRNSWISSISSKFSSGSPQSAQTTSNGNGPKAPTNGGQVGIRNSSTGAGSSPVPNGGHAEQSHDSQPYVPQAPKSGSSFFTTALRRLSSNTQVTGGAGKVIGTGGVCPRRVLNIDPNRQRCLVPELDQSKLRRVAFCVDVEIAGGPRYKSESDTGDKKKKAKDKKLKEKGEGEALKHPDTVAAEKEKDGVVQATCEAVGTEEDPNPEGTVLEEDKKLSKKKEKKKRSEEERKERKEKKRKKAEDNGSIPVQFSREEDNLNAPPGSADSGTSGSKTPQDRPTIDPVRIYRRCCQLRETPILKRITEQLGHPDSCSAATPGVVTCLDLTGSRLQLADVITLSDWLAVVPVKKLLLEDADLTDEGVRVVLAGLLAAKHPEYPRLRHKMSDTERVEERTGVIEKLTLRNNPRITREGWKHISLFIYMCKSIKALDVSMVAFPHPLPQQVHQSDEKRANPCEAADVLCKAISERLSGDHLEELIMGECQLRAGDIRKIIDGVTISGLRRLGLAGNHLDDEGLEHVIRYIRSGVCQGLDLGSNDLRTDLNKLAIAFTDKCPIWALSLADCNLEPDSIKPLLPKLLQLPNLRFLDLSHNKELFSKQPSAIALLRKFLPKLPLLKRIHLVDVSMSPAQAIALAEIIPECPQIAHLNILENPQLSALASATDEADQEEACALYASLMAAARVSEHLICVDVDVPTQENSEIVKALAKQVVAYCLRNMERFAVDEAPEAADGVAAAAAETHKSMEGKPGNEVDVPEVLLHLVGHVEGSSENLDDDEPAPDNDYIVGGTGVVKALSYCLSEKASELRRASLPTSGTATPNKSHIRSGGEAKAKDMSKNLLDSARKIRMRLQPALVREYRAREETGGDDMNYLRLLFLDNTLKGMIQRFEDEYPECRVTGARPISRGDDASMHSASPPESLEHSRLATGQNTSLSTTATLVDEDAGGESSDEERPTLRSRQNSDVSLAAKAQSIEEGHMHRLGQSVKREIYPQLKDDTRELTGEDEDEPEYLVALRSKLDGIAREDIRSSIISEGWEETLRQIDEKKSDLAETAKASPEEFKVFREAQINAEKNARDSLIAANTRNSEV